MGPAPGGRTGLGTRTPRSVQKHGETDLERPNLGPTGSYQKVATCFQDLFYPADGLHSRSLPRLQTHWTDPENDLWKTMFLYNPVVWRVDDHLQGSILPEIIPWLPWMTRPGR